MTLLSGASAEMKPSRRRSSGTAAQSRRLRCAMYSTSAMLCSCVTSVCSTQPAAFELV